MDMQKMLQEAQRMQQQLAEAQDQLGDIEAQGSAGGGMVKATVSGDLELTDLIIDPEVVDPGDVEMLQDMVRAAVNDALQKAQDMASDAMSAATGGFSIPGLM